MYKRSEGFFKGYQDLRLFFQAWENLQARGTIIINHGQGEHSECYHRLIDAFRDDAWSFYAWDLRGHGRSDGKRGYVNEFDDYCRDYDIFLERVLNDPKRNSGPVILLSHSMGGLIQLKTLVRRPAWLGKIRAQVCSAPLLGLAIPVPAIKSKGAVVLNKMMPTLTMYNEIRNSMLTRDLDVIREFEHDALRHNRISSGAFLGFLDSFEYVNGHAADVDLPTLFVLPENDPVVSTSASRQFFAHLGSSQKELITYVDAKHEMFNDIHRSMVYRDVKKFIDPFLSHPAENA